jgi:hypothetical protein
MDKQTDLEMMTGIFGWNKEPDQFAYDAFLNLSLELDRFAQAEENAEDPISTEKQEFIMLFARRMRLAGEVAFRLAQEKEGLPYTKLDPILAALRAEGEPMPIIAALDAERRSPQAAERTEEYWWEQLKFWREFTARHLQEASEL